MNLDLWKAVEKTPVEHTKPITGKAYRGTSPKPHYIVLKATETFGPCGIGWGFEIIGDRIEEGKPGDKVHIAHVRVWYEWKGKRGTVEHMGQTMFSGVNKNGPYTDEDAPKKSVTDALVKALSMVGFAGDIFIGRYDDSKYVSELRNEERQAARTPAQRTPSATYMHAKELAEANTTKAELRAWMADRKDGLMQALDADEWATFRQFIAKELAPTLPENDLQEDAA